MAIRRSILLLVLASTTLILAIAPGCARAGSESAIASVIQSRDQLRGFNSVAVSPDGRRVVWTESQPRGAAMYLASPSGEGRRIAPGYAGGDTAWSPDSHRIAFLAGSDNAGEQLYMLDVPDGAPRRLTSLTGTLADPEWSPDGKTIGVLFTANAQRLPGPLEPMTPPSGVIEQHVYEQRLALVDAASGHVRLITPSDLYVYQFQWSPNGNEIVATAAHGPGDDNWYIAQLYTIDPASGKTQSILEPGMQITNPVWSPDGKQIAYIGGLMSDEGSHGGDIYVISREGGQPRDVTSGMKASASGLAWFSSGILFTEEVDGLDAIAKVNPANGKIQTLWSSAHVPASFSNFSVARDAKTSAAVLESFEHPPEVWAGPVGRWRQITHANQALHPLWGNVKSIHWQSGKWQVQGWLLYPRNYDARRRYPMVVLIHGGPGGMNRDFWPASRTLGCATAALSAQGYFVLYPNPRGSFGDGEAFTRANIRDFGYGDLRDIIAGAKHVAATLPVDQNRIGITGWSYGGYMTMWAVTQTHLFRAAVTGAGIADWKSYYGENDIDQWMIPFFKASVYNDPAIYARSSPINFIKNVKTPTLVLVGDRDGECPAPQSFEFWHALRTLGVKTQLVVYPDEGHGISQPKHQRDIIERTVAWFNANLK